MTDVIMVSWMDKETELITKIRWVELTEFGDAETILDEKDIKDVEKAMVKIAKRNEVEV